MINQSNKEYLIIYSLRLYKKLVAAGIFPAKQMVNPKDSRFNCWAFEDCEQVREVLNATQMEADRKGGSL